MREWETEIVRFFTGLQQPLLDQLAWVLTFMGNETFYFLVLPFVYWCVSKKFGIRLLYVLVLSVYIKSFLKMTFAITRPVGTEGINSLYVESAEVGTHFPHDSFPSGHAQGSATLWWYIAASVKKRSFWIFSIILVLLISFSRLYTGVHWPADIIGGMAIATVILLVARFIENIIDSLTEMVKFILAVIVPLMLVLIFPEPEGYRYGGFLLGGGIGYFIEKNKLDMVIPSSWVNRLAAYLVGIAGIFALQTGLKAVFPEAWLFDGLRYALIGLWGLWIAPWLFVKIRLYRRKY
ncbi:PAP2 superfamily protein [Evansella caseinilytica]|uniref:PAP2 superfamily protein n=1 Tax=Evansella caseinilytica TaxID=1503961 RepID=A0A1H3PNZ0_9BACI|nr:phosphatase PAP2 family protein [Evansella caseinilytica]SDZ02680.1 PAP2 superfamily protein [Evansella caseinilytica]